MPLDMYVRWFQYVIGFTHRNDPFLQRILGPNFGNLDSGQRVVCRQPSFPFSKSVRGVCGLYLYCLE